MYQPDTSKLRRRTKRSEHGPSESPWQSGKGEFYKYQMQFREKFPDTFFENEVSDPDSNLVECSVTGFDGSIKELLYNETDQVSFVVADGRIVARFNPVKPKKINKPGVLLGLSWVLSLFALLLFMYTNFGKYSNILS